MRYSRTFFSDFPKSFHFGVEKILTARSFGSRSLRRQSFPIMRSPNVLLKGFCFMSFLYYFSVYNVHFFHSPSWLRIEFVFGLNPSLSEHGSPQQAGNCIRTFQGTPGPSHCRPRGLLTNFLFSFSQQEECGKIPGSTRFDQDRPGNGLYLRSVFYFYLMNGVLCYLLFS